MTFIIHIETDDVWLVYHAAREEEKKRQDMSEYDTGAFLAGRAGLFHAGLDAASAEGFSEDSSLLHSLVMSATGVGNLGGIRPGENAIAITSSGTTAGSGSGLDQVAHDVRNATFLKKPPPPLAHDVIVPERETHAEIQELDNVLNSLEELEIHASPFAIPSAVRSDSLSLFGRVVETVVILLAVQHSINLTRTTENMFVAPLLFLMVYFNSQIKYLIMHLSRMIALVRRRMAKSEREELIQRQRLMKEEQEKRSAVVAENQTLIKDSAVSQHQQQKYTILKRTSSTGDVLSEEDVAREQFNSITSDAKYELPSQLRRKFPVHSVYTLAHVRLSSSEMAFSFISNMLYLINVYITFLLVKTIMDKINSSFSDGIWIMVKALVFVILVVPVYVEFQVASYRQEWVTRTHRL